MKRTSEAQKRARARNWAIFTIKGLRGNLSAAVLYNRKYMGDDVLEHVEKAMNHLNLALTALKRKGS